MIDGIESKLFSVCLINDYLPIADFYIFVYGCAELSSISLECTKVKLSILNNLDNIIVFLLPIYLSFFKHFEAKVVFLSLFYVQYILLDLYMEGWLVFCIVITLPTIITAAMIQKE